MIFVFKDFGFIYSKILFEHYIYIYMVTSPRLEFVFFLIENPCQIPWCFVDDQLHLNGFLQLG